MKGWLFSIGFALYGTSMFGQLFQGIVVDANTNEPLIGANVLKLDGTGTTTDLNGQFSFDVIAEKEVLTIMYIGYSSLVSDTLYGATQNVKQVFRLTPELVKLSEMVVSAGLFEQRLEEITVSLDVIKPNLQQDKNLVRMEATLQQAPGVNVTDGQANIRGGSGWSYGTGTRVQTLVDNIPLISGDAGQAQWDLVPVHSINRIEVLKGASSVLYGSAAMNGIINVITHPFPDKPSLSVNLYSGIYDSPKRSNLKWWDGGRFNSGFNFDYQKPLSSQSGLIIGAGHIADQAFRYLEDEQRTRIFAKYLYKSNKIKGLEASLATNINYTDGGDALIWESDELGYIPSDSAITNTYGWDFFIDPTINYRRGRFLHTLKGRYLKLNNYAKSSEADYTNISDQYFGQYMLQFFYSTKLALTAGISSSTTESNSVVFVGRHISSNNAVFAQGDYKPWPWLNLNAGLRYENYHLDERFTEKPVFRGGLNVQIIKGTNFRFSYGEAFRFPTISEAYTSTSFGAINVYPNNDLEPETGNSFEVGLRQMLYTKKVKGYLDIAVFQMRYQNMIEFTFGGWGASVPPGFGLGFKPLNVGETLIRGIEFSSSLEGKLGKKRSYRLLAGYTYILPQVVNPDQPFAQDVNQNDLTYEVSSSSPENRILKYRYQHLLKLDGQLTIKKWHGGASFRYNDFMQNIDRLFNDAVAGVQENRERNYNGDVIVDLRIGYSISEKWQVDLITNNLFNEEVMIRPGFLGGPRNFSLRLNYSL